MTAFWRSLGVQVRRREDPSPVLNVTPLGGIRDTTTPRAMAATFRKLTLGDALSPTSRSILVNWQIANTTGGDRLRAGLSPAWPEGDKTGNNGRDATIDLAVTWAPRGPIIIAAFTRGGSPTAEQFREVFRAVGELAASRLA